MSDEPLTDSVFFVMRTPLLAYDELLGFSEGLEAPHEDDADRLEDALRRDRQRLRDRLSELLKRSEVRDALFVASPDLDVALEHWRRDPDGARGQKAERALVRYFERMAARCTPFGLFAGCSVGRIGERTELGLEPRERNERHTRLDQDYLDALLLALEAEGELRDELTFRPNSSLYRAAGQHRYVEKRMRGRVRSHHLAAVEDSEYLTSALEHARDEITPGELTEALSADGISPAGARAYVMELIESQVLIPDLDIPVTGPEPLALLAEELSAFAATAAVGRRLGEVRDGLEAIDADGVGAEPSRYREVAATLEELPVDVDLRRLFQVDMHKPAPALRLGRPVMRELERGIRLLHRISPAIPQPELDAFRARFAERFEGREVPLVEALDDDVGVGFPEPDRIGVSPLLAGLVPSSETDERVEWGARQRFLLRHLLEVVERRERSLVLGAADLEQLAVDDPLPLPDAFAATAVLASPSAEALEAGDFQLFLDGVVGPSGARMLGRFARGDPELRGLIEHHLRQEEALRPDAVFAEVVHLPEGRIGNIVNRPLLRRYEIPYLGRSGAPPECQIPVADLMVSIAGHPTRSPEGDTVVLRSRRLGRRVFPRMTMAHNFTLRTVPTYRFFGYLQSQDHGDVAWSWGPLKTAPFLPRVQTGRLVLSLARWRLEGAELEELGRGVAGDRFRAVQRLREQRGLPRMLGLADWDNVLPVDLDNALSVEAFASAVKGREAAALVELWPASEELCAHGPEGRYAHELVVPFVRTAPVPADAARASVARQPARATPGPARTLPPGSDWLYAKLYVGHTAGDRILRDVVAPLVENVLGSGAADAWFFIRYADPHEHLRLRFHGEPDALHKDVLPRVQAVLAPLVEEGTAWRLAFDTYERELQRYGGPEGVALAERIFHADSDAVLELLSMFERGERGAEERWRMGLCGTSMLLADLGLDEPQRIELLRGLREAFGREYRVDPAYARKLGERLREHRRELEPLVAPAGDLPADLKPGIEALRRRSERTRPLVAELDELERAGRLATSRLGLASSFAHMYMNRLMRSAPRLHELAIYDFLLRLYGSRAARTRKGM